MKKDDIIELDSAEVSLLLEAVKKQIKRVEEDKFYRNEHPDAFYQIYLGRYWNLYLAATTSISKLAPRGRFETPSAVRAGSGC